MISLVLQISSVLQQNVLSGYLQTTLASFFHFWIRKNLRLPWINTQNVKNWCDISKLSINPKKTKFMLIKSVHKKRNTLLNIILPSNEGTISSLKQNDHVRYLGIMIDDKLSRKYHISFFSSSRISRNCGILFKLRH